MRCERSTPDFSVCSVVFSDLLTADVRLGFDSIRIPTFEGVLFSGLNCNINKEKSDKHYDSAQRRLDDLKHVFSIHFNLHVIVGKHCRHRFSSLPHHHSW